MKYFLFVLAGLLITGFLKLVFQQEGMIFFPEVLSREYRFHFDELDFEERYYRTEENTEIHGLLFRSKKDNSRLVLYFHGNAGSLKSWGFVAPAFLDRGYDIFIPDYRGYGKSTGPLSEKGLVSDAEFIFRELSGEYKDIVIYGRSIGSGIACALAGVVAPHSILLESPFYSLADIVRKHYPFVPSFLLRYKFENYSGLAVTSSPVYIIHGGRDGIIPLQSGKKLAATRPDITAFTEIKNGSHNDLSGFPEYHAWLDNALPVVR